MLLFLKNWTLPISMFIGIFGYLLVDALPLSTTLRQGMLRGAELVQPMLIFAMLFLACCRINYKELRLRPWHVVLLMVQALLFLLFGIGTLWLRGSVGSIVLECAMLCAIMPTATAAAVVTNKLKGDMTGVITYTMLSNLLAAVTLPLFAPFLHSHSCVPFWQGFFNVLAHIFPILVVPFLLAVAVRVLSPRLLKAIGSISDLAFYLWCICLPISIALAMRTLMHARLSFGVILCIAGISLGVCLFSFYIGRKVGCRYGTSVAGAQSLGQKNTAFGIWVAYTFLTPVTSVAGGFYAIWHNVYNAWQLSKQRKKESNAS